MTSRFVVIPAYELQGVNATRTTNWYYGAGQGLGRYAHGGTAYDEAYWQQRYAAMPDDYKDAMNSVPLARFHFEFDSTKLTPTSQREMSSFLEGKPWLGEFSLLVTPTISAPSPTTFLSRNAALTRSLDSSMWLGQMPGS